MTGYVSIQDQIYEAVKKAVAEKPERCAKMAEKQWKVSWVMWPFLWPEAHCTEKIYDSEEEAKDHIKGLLTMQAPHPPRQCDKHVWDINLDERNIGEWGGEAMTPDLRKIAEAVTGNHWERGITVEAAKMIATLLDAVVEAEAKAIRWEWRWQGGYGEGKTSIEIEKLSIQKALRELNLEGVWPVKEK